MKAFLALFALAAVVAADSDAWLGYSGLYPYSGLYNYGYNYGLAYGGCRNHIGQLVPCRAKRDADSDAWLGYSGLYPYSGLYNYGYNAYNYGYNYGLGYSGCRNAAGLSVPCRIAKRDADSDAWYGYSNLGLYGYPYTAGYGYLGYARPAIAGYTGFDNIGRPAIKAGPCTNSLGEVVPC